MFKKFYNEIISDATIPMYGEIDINEYFDNPDPFGFIEALNNDDLFNTKVINRMIKNTHENEMENFYFMNALLSQYGVKGSCFLKNPYSVLSDAVTSISTTTATNKSGDIVSVGYVIINPLIAMINNKILNIKPNLFILERQIRKVLSLYKVLSPTIKEGVEIKESSTNKFMCKITKIINGTTRYIYFGCTETTWNTDVFASAYNSLLELIININNYNDAYADFRGDLYSAVSGNFELYKGEYTFNINNLTGKIIYLDKDDFTIKVDTTVNGLPIYCYDSLSDKRFIIGNFNNEKNLLEKPILDLIPLNETIKDSSINNTTIVNTDFTITTFKQDSNYRLGLEALNSSAYIRNTTGISDSQHPIISFNAYLPINSSGNIVQVTTADSTPLTTYITVNNETGGFFSLTANYTGDTIYHNIFILCDGELASIGLPQSFTPYKTRTFEYGYHHILVCGLNIQTINNTYPIYFNGIVNGYKINEIKIFSGTKYTNSEFLFQENFSIINGLNILDSMKFRTYGDEVLENVAVTSDFKISINNYGTIGEDVRSGLIVQREGKDFVLSDGMLSRYNNTVQTETFTDIWNGYSKISYPDDTLNNIITTTDGQIIIASSTDYIYISKDAGDTWNKKEKPGTYNIKKILMSADTSLLIIIKEITNTYELGIYISKDLGETWVFKNEGVIIEDMALSSTGQYQIKITAVGVDPIRKAYISNNCGFSWTEQTEIINPYSCGIDLNYLTYGFMAIGTTDGKIYGSLSCLQLLPPWASRTLDTIGVVTRIESIGGYFLVGLEAEQKIYLWKLYQENVLEELPITGNIVGNELAIDNVSHDIFKIKNYYTLEHRLLFESYSCASYNLDYLYMIPTYGNTFYISRDRGLTYTSYSLNAQEIVCSKNGSKIFAIDGYSDSIKYNTNYGNSSDWHTSALPVEWPKIFNGNPHNISCDSTGTIITSSYTIGDTQKTIISTDGGANFSYTTGIPFGSSHVVSEVSNDGTFIIFSAGGGIYISTDSGASFTKKLTAFFDAVCCNKNGEIIVGSTSTKIYYSTDFGETWLDYSISTPFSWLKSSLNGDFFIGLQHYTGTYYNLKYSYDMLDWGNLDDSYYSRNKTSSTENLTSIIAGNKLLSKTILFKSNFYAKQIVEYYDNEWKNFSLSYDDPYNVFDENNNILLENMDKIYSDISISRSGKFILLAESNGYIYYSEDYGNRFKRIDVLGTNSWNSCSIIEDDYNNNFKFAIVSAYSGNVNQIFQTENIDIDSNWIQSTSAPAFITSLKLSRNGWYPYFSNFVLGTANNCFIYKASNNQNSQFHTYPLSGNFIDCDTDYDYYNSVDANSPVGIICSTSDIYIILLRNYANDIIPSNSIIAGLPIKSWKLVSISIRYGNLARVVVASDDNAIYTCVVNGYGAIVETWEQIIPHNSFSNIGDISLINADNNSYELFVAHTGFIGFGTYENSEMTWENNISYENFENNSNATWNTASSDTLSDCELIIGSYTDIDDANKFIRFKKEDKKILYTKNLFKDTADDNTWKFITSNDVEEINEETIPSDLPITDSFWNETIEGANGHYFNNINNKRILAAVSKSPTINGEYKLYIINCLKNKMKVGNVEDGYFIMHDTGELEVFITAEITTAETESPSSMAIGFTCYKGEVEKTFPIKFSNDNISIDISKDFGSVSITNLTKEKIKLSIETSVFGTYVYNIKGTGRWKE